jgi:DNA excision repair protein ERCC-1
MATPAPTEEVAANSDESKRPKISGSIIVSSRQRGNPILKSIRLVSWEFNDTIVPDYIIGEKASAVYLSLRYHTLNPNYIHERLKTFTGSELRVLLVQVDISEPHHALKQLMRISILSDLTLMLAWSHEEAGKILETYKAFENKPPDMIMEKSNPDPHSKLVDALTSVKSVNKTDAVTLISVFGSLEGIVQASIEDLTLCQGFGPQKAQRLHKVLHQTFKR